MSNALLMLLKAFRKEKWAEGFLDGCLYCNTLRYYRECDEDRRDKQEGAIVPPVENLKLSVGSVVLANEDIAGFTYHPKMADYINVFCMYSWAPPKVGEDQVLLDKETQLGSINELERTYGPFSVLIKDIPEFLRRLKRVVERPESRVIQAKGGLVEYRMMDVFPTTPEETMRVAFHKNPSYASEQEYRFAFLLDQEKPGPCRLNIGNIRDIAGRIRTKDVYDAISVNGSKNF